MKSTPASQITLAERVGLNHTIAPMIIPPDGGWGWVIVFSGFLAFLVTDGVSVCFFLYKEPMERDLALNPGDIPLLSAFFTGFYFLGGILACSIGNYFGFRIVMVIGATSLGVTFALGYVFDKFLYFLAVIGVIGGLGAGLVFASGALPAGFYFDKKRSIAVGLVSCGAGAGAVVIPHVTKAFINQYGWRLTYLFHASLFIIVILTGLLIRPLKPVVVVFKPPSWISMKTARNSFQEYSKSIFPVGADDSFSAAPSVARSVMMAATDFQTISQVAHDVDMISIIVRNDSEYHNTVGRLQGQSRDLGQPSVSMIRHTTVHFEPDEIVEEPLPWYCCGCCRSRHRYQSIPERPLQRTDVLYTGAIQRLQEYKSAEKDLDYHMHVTMVPTHFETFQIVTRTYVCWCCRSILHGIKALLDYTLLKKPTFVCLALCSFANYLAFFLPILFGRARLEMLGKGEYTTTLVSMIGLGTMIGRIFSGVVVTAIPKVGARTAASFTAFLASLAVIATTIYHHIIYQLGCMLVYGMAIGFYAPLRSIIIVDFLGLNALTSATGMCLLFQGFGSFLGAPLAEAVLEYTKDKNSPYYVSGGALMFSCVILWPMRILQRWENK